MENVLKYESKNVKALFRQGKALFQLGKFDEVILPLKRILQIQSNHPDKEQIMQMIQSAEHKVALYQQNEKEIYRRMFQSSTTANNNSLTSRPSTIKTQVIHHFSLRNHFIAIDFRRQQIICGIMWPLEVLS